MSKYRVCVTGCSEGRGRDHVRAFAENGDRFEIVGLCDLQPERAQALGKEFAIEALYDDADKMLGELKPDVFCFVTQPQVRLSLVELAISHGVRAIAYEKPMSDNWPEARAIHKAVSDAGVMTIQSHQHKYGQYWRAARKLIEDGEIGDILSVSASSTGWLLHYVSHLLDYSMYLTGREQVSWVIGHAHGRSLLCDPHPSPENVLLHYAFADGLQGSLLCGSLAPFLPPGGIEPWMNAGVTVLGTHGHVQVVSGSGLWAHTKSGKTARDESSFSPDHDQPLYIRELADCLDDPSKVHSCNGDKAFHGFSVAMAGLISALDHRRVDLPLESDDDVLERLRNELPDCVGLPNESWDEIVPDSSETSRREK
ncbi:MAG: Gfo/Idh/MocA family oxidoreductase [Lentisphaerae bacterium]|nr:Gfo/Idh/MocA family oxidoreductase [Lentisphaerota bacterium]